MTLSTTPAQGDLHDLRITGPGLQVLGEWPRFEAVVSPATLAEAVERFGEFAPDDEQRALFRRVAAYLRAKSGGTVRATAIAVGAQLARNAIGLPVTRDLWLRLAEARGLTRE